LNTQLRGKLQRFWQALSKTRGGGKKNLKRKKRGHRLEKDASQKSTGEFLNMFWGEPDGSKKKGGKKNGSSYSAGAVRRGGQGENHEKGEMYEPESVNRKGKEKNSGENVLQRKVYSWKKKYASRGQQV